MMFSQGSIKNAEKSLLNDGLSFDEERLDFINCFKTCDLLAVPGSGKTTALLAKLMCMADAQPFDSGSGLLVLAHTNVAVEEIKNRLSKSHVGLFQYPNFVGTVQSFINKFLAIPHYVDSIGYRPYAISQEKYDEAIIRKLSNEHKGDIAYLKMKKSQIFQNARFSRNDKGEVFLSDGIDGESLDFETPKKWTVTQKKQIKQKISNWKTEIMTNGILHFDDCYYLANSALFKKPRLRNILQKRFGYVFIDEMQDLEKHQIDIIDDIFYNETSDSVIQRIGDKNQAIYSSTKKMKDFSVWQSRDEKYLSGSHRLTQKNAQIINALTLDNSSGNFDIVGKRVINAGSISPHLIVFSNSNKDQLLSEFDGLITKFQNEGKIPKKPAHPLKVIAWNSEWPNEEEVEEGKIRLKDVFPSFSKKRNKKRESFLSLSEFINADLCEFKDIRESLLNIFVKILRIEGKKFESQIRGSKINLHYSKSKIIEYIKELGIPIDAYNVFMSRIFTCSRDILAGNHSASYSTLSDFIRTEFKNWFNLKINDETQAFLGDRFEIRKEVEKEGLEPSELDRDDYSNIKISTVHSSKGQTHCATMYIETFFYKYETQHIPEPLQGNAHNLKVENNKDKRKKHAIKMMYVGLSRPTHLLCLAVLHDNVCDDLEEYEKAGWVIHNMCQS